MGNLRLSLLPRERLSQLPRPPLRLMLKLTQKLTHGCTTLDLDTTVLDTMDMPHSPTAMPHTPTLTPMPTMASHTLITARDPLMLSQKPMLRLIQPSSTALTDTPTHMDMDTDMVDFHTLTTHMPTMERDLLMLRPKLTQRPMLTPISSMVDITDLTLIMLVTTHTPMDIHTPMDFGERSKSKLSHSLLK